jgi:malonyl-CoA O-methyltransferase
VSRQLDKKRVRHSFDQAARTYDDAAVVQQRMAEELIDRLDVLKISPGRILDAGCGSGFALPGLMQRYPDAEFVLLDFSAAMLARLTQSRSEKIFPVCGDIERIPLASRSVDMIFCNAALEWCELEAVLDEYLRVLKPEGLLTFATFGPDTLVELAAAWQKIDDGAHVHRFSDMHNIGDALVSHQFTIPVMDVDYLTVTHRDLDTALQDLRGQGGGNAVVERHRGLTGKQKFRAFERVADALRNERGLIESTCEIIYGHAWAPAQIRSGENGDRVEVPLERLRRRE